MSHTPRLGGRSSDPRYCAECGILWNDPALAAEHRRTKHGPKARARRKGSRSTKQKNQNPMPAAGRPIPNLGVPAAMLEPGSVNAAAVRDAEQALTRTSTRTDRDTSGDMFHAKHDLTRCEPYTYCGHCGAPIADIEALEAHTAVCWKGEVSPKG